MTIHIDIKDAEARLGELVAAAARGEDVVLDQAGSPRARLTAMPQHAAEEVERRAAKRRAAIGMFKHLSPERGIDVRALRQRDFWDERDRIKFGDLD